MQEHLVELFGKGLMENSNTLAVEIMAVGV